MYLYIPNNAVGAIIGTKGSQIRNMIRFSNASIKIASPEGDKADSNERKVTIVGTPEAQWKVTSKIYLRAYDRIHIGKKKFPFNLPKKKNNTRSICCFKS